MQGEWQILCTDHRNSTMPVEIIVFEVLQENQVSYYLVSICDVMVD